MIIRQIKLRGTIAIGLTLNVAAAGTGMWAYQPPAKPEAKEQTPELSRKQAEQSTWIDRYGDPLPQGALARIGSMRFRHPGDACGLAFSPNGEILAAYCANSGIILWNAADGRELRRLQVNAGQIQARPFDFSPTGEILAALDFDADKIIFWKTATGEQLRTLPLGAKPRIPTGTPALRFSADGKLVAVMTDNTSARVLDAVSGTVRCRIQVSTLVHDLAFSPDGQTLVLAADRPTVQLWDVRTGKMRRSFASQPKDTLAGALTFSADGRFLACARGDDIEVHELAGEKIVARLADKSEGVIGLAFTPDGKTLVAAGNDCRVRVWDLAAQKLRRTFDSHGRDAGGYYRLGGRGFALSRDGKRAALGLMRKTVHVWDLATGRELGPNSEGTDGDLDALIFTADGKTLFTAGRNRPIQLWGTATWRERRRFEEQTFNLSLTCDGQWLASAPNWGDVHILDVTGGERVRKLPSPDNETITHINFLGRSRRLAALHYWHATRPIGGVVPPPRVVVWDTEKQSIAREVKVPRGQGNLVVSSDGRSAFLTSAENDKGVTDVLRCDLENPRTDTFCPMPPKTWTNGLAISPDNRLLASAQAWAGTLIWEVDSGEQVRVCQAGKSYVHRIAFSTDGRILASAEGTGYFASETKGMPVIHFWNVRTGEEMGRLHGHRADVQALAFSPNNTRLVTALEDGAMLVWDVSFLSARLHQPLQHLSNADLERCWTELRAAGAGKAQQTVWKLAAAPNQVVPFLRERLRPVKGIEAAVLRRWIADLDSADFAVREAASRSLAGAGRQAEPLLRRTLTERPSLEVRRRVEDLLHRPNAKPSADMLRSLRALVVLEQIGTAEARQVLKTLAQGLPEARVTREAKESLERLAARHHPEKR